MGEDDAWPCDRVMRRREELPDRCERRPLASILGLTFETLKAWNAGTSANGPRLTPSETPHYLCLGPFAWRIANPTATIQ